MTPERKEQTSLLHLSSLRPEIAITEQQRTNRAPQNSCETDSTKGHLQGGPCSASGGLSGQSDCLTTSSLSDPKREGSKGGVQNRSVAPSVMGSGSGLSNRPFFVCPNNASSLDKGLENLVRSWLSKCVYYKSYLLSDTDIVNQPR